MVAIILMASVCSAMAQKGEMAGGIQLNYGTQIESMGIGAKFQYGITDAIRVEPSFNYFFGKNGGNMFDFNVNAHYLFSVAPKVHVYPLVGLGYASIKGGGIGISYDGGESWGDYGYESSEDEYEETSSSSRSGNITVNLGAGAEYQLTDRLAINAEIKYQIISNFNQVVIGIGAAYKF